MAMRMVEAEVELLVGSKILQLQVEQYAATNFGFDKCGEKQQENGTLESKQCRSGAPYIVFRQTWSSSSQLHRALGRSNLAGCDWGTSGA